MFKLTLDLILRIVIYVTIGLVPLIYSIKLIKFRTSMTSKKYHYKLGSYVNLSPCNSNEVNSSSKMTLNVTSDNKLLQNVKPYIIVLRTITPMGIKDSCVNANARSYENLQYIVLVVNVDLVKTPEILVDALSDLVKEV